MNFDTNTNYFRKRAAGIAWRIAHGKPVSEHEFNLWEAVDGKKYYFLSDAKDFVTEEEFLEWHEGLGDFQPLP